MIETWRWIKGYKGYYKVSTNGRVKAVSRVIPHSAHGTQFRKEKILKPGFANGYPMVILCKKGRIKYRTVHSLVLEAFVGPCPEGMQARHYPDGTKTNCKLSNLSYCTPVQNGLDRKEHGTEWAHFGENAGSSLYSNEVVSNVKAELAMAKKGDQRKIARKYGMSEALVSLIKHGKMRTKA